MSEQYFSPDWYQDPITNEWKLSEPILIRRVRAERGRLLHISDWTQLVDTPLGNKRTAWETYRQALRDIPQQAGFPFDVVWPTPPQ